jgi:arginase
MDGTRTDRPQQRPSRIALVGAPVEVGAGHRGAIMGPAGLRTAGLLPSLQGLGFEVEDLGDLAPARPLPAVAETPQMRFLPEIAGWARVLSDRAHALMSQGTLPIFLGGDHSLSMGSVNGVLRHCREAGRELFVLWLDAHTDFNTPATTPSGNMHGMSAALLCGEPGLDDVFGTEPRERLDPKNLTIFGARSIDREERALLRRRGVEVFDMRLIDEYGVSVLMRRILDKIASRNGVLHVSLDVDFLDPSIAPGVGTTVPGGATYREAHLIMEMLYDSGLVGSLDVVELNPFLDDRGKSALLLVDLVSSLFGRQIIEPVGALERAASGAQ